MAVVNKAAWLMSAGATSFEVGDAPSPNPGPHDIVIRNYATAINPFEIIMQNGLLVDTYPSILGSDIAGEIAAVGAEVIRFQKGDRVIAMADGTHNVMTGSERDTRRMAFQLFVTTSEKVAAKLPPNIDYVHGCVLPLALSTAAIGLFQRDCLALSHPTLAPQSKDQVVFIWGGSSSVGSCAIQLAVAAGYEVATTASDANSEYCRELGARTILNHRSTTAVEDVVKALHGKTLAGAFCVIWNDEAIVSAAQVVSQLSELKFIQTVMSPGVPAPSDIPAGFTVGTIFRSTLKDNEVGDAVWVNWVTSALESGALQCKPEPEVVGKGLGELQVGMARAKAGVSATKIVVEID